jgi:maleate cis-trans isomerase
VPARPRDLTRSRRFGLIVLSPHNTTMGQQLNKIIKRKRRAAYLKRKKVAAAAAKKK